MRALLLCSLALLSLVFSGCTQEAPANPPAAQVTPIGARMDWSTAGTRAARERDESARALEEGPATSGAAKPSAAGARGDEPSATAKRNDSLGRIQPRPHHALYARLPKDALLVIDLPDIANLMPALRRCEIARLLADPDVRSGLSEMEAGLRAGLEKACSESSEAAAAFELLPRLGGSFVFSVSGLTAESLAGSQGPGSFVVTMLYDAGAQADEVAAAVAPMLALYAQNRDAELLEKPEPAWGCEIGDEKFLVDFERRGDVFELRAGNRSAVVRELAALRKRNDATSFFTARVAADASSVVALGAAPVLELHLQLTPLWDAIRASGNRNDLKLLERTGLANFYGASLSLGRTEEGLAEALTLHSPAGVDLFTHLVTGKDMDRTLARSIPAGLANAGLYSFDGSRLISDLFLLVPSQAQGGLVRAIGDFRRQVGIDLEKEILGNFGPTFAFASSSSLAVLRSGEIPRLFAACTLGDAGRAQRTLNALLVASGRFTDAREQLIEGVRVFSLAVPAGELAPELEIHWCVSGEALLVATEIELLREAMQGQRGSEILHEGLRSALAKAGDDVFSAGFELGTDGAPNSIQLGKRSLAGLEWTSSDGRAFQSSMAVLFTGGLVSSLAIPQLLQARNDANQKAALTRLVVVNDAQRMAQIAGELDQDSDGKGECLFLDELCGDAPLRQTGERLADPWLDSGYEWVAPGIGQLNGYRSRVDLQLVDGRSACSASALGATAVAVEIAEQSFLAYSWPALPNSGSTVFVFDSARGLFSSDNRGAQQGYVGERAPKSGAHLPAEGLPPRDKTHVGRDGGTWLYLRGL